MKLVSLTFILLLCMGCQSDPFNVTTHYPAKYYKTIDSEDKAWVEGSLDIVQPMPSRYWTATWTYPEVMPMDNVEFDVVGTTNLQDWYLIARTNQPPVGWWSDKPMEFINVGAHWMIQPE